VPNIEEKAGDWAAKYESARFRVGMSSRASLRLSALAVLAVAACTQDFGVFEPDGAAGDGGTDAASSDAAEDVATQDAAQDSGATEAGALAFACGTGTVSDCSQCNGMPQPCVYCKQGDATSLAGRCTTAGTSCAFGAPSGYGECTCANSASSCPESYEVCRFGSCRTCSDSNTNDGLTCQNGGKCDSQDGGCN